MKEKIILSKNSTLKEALDHPEGEKLMKKYQFPCITCPFAQMEMEKLTLGQIAVSYHLDLEKFLTEINQSH